MTKTKSTPKNKRSGKISQKKWGKITEAACNLIENWDSFSKKRLNTIKEYELAYYGNVRPTLKGRSNFPFPVLAKYVDELKGLLDNLPAIKLEHHKRYAQILVAKKAQASLDQFKKPTKGDWARNDRMGRINSIFSGYCAMDFFTDVTDKGFNAHAVPIDHNDFVFDPLGGSDLEAHRGVGKIGMFRTKAELESLAEEGIYDSDQVEKLIAATNNAGIKKNAGYYMARYARYKAMSLDVENNQYAGEDIYALATIQLTYNGERYYVTLDPSTKIAVRLQPLEEVFASGLYSICLYQTHEDPNVVMCKAPVDDIYSVAEGMRVKINQMFDASTKQLWGQKIVDPNFFPDVSQLEWRRPDQISIGRAYQGKPISTGIYEMKSTFDFGSNLEFVKYLDEFLTSVVGVNPNDVSEDVKKVGILFGQMQKQGSRLGPQNKSYSEMWSKGIYRILHGMKENMSEPLMVKTIGTMGAEWDEFSRSELGDPEDFEIIVASSTVEEEMNEALAKRKQAALDSIKMDPVLSKEVSPRWLVENILKGARFEDEEIGRAMDVKNYGNEESIARADAAIEQILKGKKPAVYKGADLAFFKYLYDYGMKLDDSDEKVKRERMAILYYGQQHLDIVVKNEAMMASTMAALAPKPDPTDGGDKGGGGDAPVEEKPQGGAPVGKKPAPSPNVVPSHIVARNKAAFPQRPALPPMPQPPAPSGAVPQGFGR